MRRAVAVTLVGLALALPQPCRAQAAPRVQQVVFRTWPPGATVTLLDPEKVVLGRSGVPLPLDLAKIQGPSRSSFRVRFELPGYRPSEETIGSYSFGETQTEYPHPPESPLRLEASIPIVVDAAYAAILHPVAAGALTLGLAIGLAIVLPRRQARRRAEREAVSRAQRVERLMASADRSDPLVGATLGGYRLVERLGAGGMATVYRGLPEATLDEAAAVAVKVISKALASEPEFLRRFDHEARACSALRHPAVIEMYASGEQDGVLYMAIELVRGEPLSRRVAAGPMSAAEALAILRPVLQGVAHAHAQRIIHRDLKPDNVMITADGRVKVMDFGLARGHNLSRITVTGTALGTPAYMSPEQISGGSVDHRTDQYALGIMAYELLAGHPPFDDEDPMALIFKHLTEPPPPLRDLRPDVPEALERIVMRMIEKDAAARFASLDEVLQALEPI